MGPSRFVLEVVVLTRKRLEAIVREWQEALGLSRWRVEIDWSKTCNEDAHASVRLSDDYDKATVWFDTENWPKWEVRFAEEIVVHELMHCHLRNLDRVAADLEGQLQRDAQILFDRRYSHEQEALVDRLALLFVELRS